MNTLLGSFRVLRGGYPFALGILCTAIAAAEPRSWRGDGSGQFPDAQPPQVWSEKSGIVWKCELPGAGHASPVFAGDRLFVAAEPSYLVCVSAADGAILWKGIAGYAAALGQEKAAEIEQTYAQLDKELAAAGKAYDALRKSDPDAAKLPDLKKDVEAIEQRANEYDKQYPHERGKGGGNAAATPVTDGEHVFVAFCTGIVAAFDIEGKRLWARHVGVSPLDWGHAASPVIADRKLIVHVDDLTALDPKTGAELWRAKVPAKCGTSAVAQVGKEDVLITPSGAVVRARDGRILAEKQFDLSYNSPLVHQGIIYAHELGKIKAIRLPASLDDPFHITPLWESKGSGDQRMGSAVWHDGLLYAGTRLGVLDVTDAKTGRAVYRRRVALGELFPSIVAAGGMIFVSGTEGKTLVLRPGRNYDEVSVNQLDGFRTSPIFIGQRMYLRVDQALYCIGR